MLNNMLGYKDGTAKGAGDTNFQLHVVNNNSQFQIGANAGQRMEISIGDMSAKALGIDKLDMSTTEGAQSAIEKLDQALARVSAERSKLGAYANRLNYTVNNLENTATNLTDAESRVRDADMAAEMINFTSAQIMQQAGTAMLAQANAMGQSVLSLLG
jgi:flagellin